MKSPMERLGRFPVEGKEVRQRREMVVVKKEDALQMIHGKDNHVLISLFVSNDRVHVGTMTIPANQFSDPETHKGDEVFYVVSGPVSILIEEMEAQGGEGKSVSTARYEVQEGERFLIPEGWTHRYYNPETSSAKLLFTIAPGL